MNEPLHDQGRKWNAFEAVSASLKIFRAALPQLVILAAVLAVPTFAISVIGGTEKWGQTTDVTPILSEDGTQPAVQQPAAAEAETPAEVSQPQAAGAAAPAPAAAGVPEPGFRDAWSQLKPYQVIILGLYMLLAAAIYVLQRICFILIAAALARGETLSWRAAIQQALGHFWPAAWTTFLVTLALIGLAVLLVFPALIFSIFYAFVLQAVVLRNMNGVEALKYSKNVVKGDWWHTFSVILLGSLIGLAAVLAIDLITAPVKLLMGDSIPFRFLGAFFRDLVAAFSVTVSTILFLNLEAVKGPLPPKN